MGRKIFSEKKNFQKIEKLWTTQKESKKFIFLFFFSFFFHSKHNANDFFLKKS